MLYSFGSTRQIYLKENLIPLTLLATTLAIGSFSLAPIVNRTLTALAVSSFTASTLTAACITTGAFALTGSIIGLVLAINALYESRKIS